MIYIKILYMILILQQLPLRVERDGITNYVGTRDTGYGTTSTDINDFTEDWSDSEYDQLEEFFKRLSRNSTFILPLIF